MSDTICVNCTQLRHSQSVNSHTYKRHYIRIVFCNRSERGSNKIVRNLSYDYKMQRWIA